MSKALIIAEKPSLAQKIIGAIENMKKKDDYYEGEKFIVTSVFGHLLTLYDIEDYTGEEKKYWDLDDIPYFPTEFKYKIKDDSGIKKRYKLIKDLIKRNDIDEVVNAGDADREGEVLINIVVYKIFKELHIQKKMTRIWLEDQTEGTIRKELKYRRDIKNTENLYNEGLARAYIDWLYGINLTRYISLKAGTTLNTGRVIIPTVKYVYDRDMKIKNFKPETYYTISATINKNNKDIKLDFKELRFNKEELEQAKIINQELTKSKLKVIKIENKETKKSPQKLFSLATIQNYMSKKYKINLDKTLNLVQSLYEKGYLTYPRTNTEYMSEEEIPKVENILSKLNDSNLQIKKSKSIFDSSKVESHSAITITEKIANVDTLSEDERKLYLAIKNRFMANFCKEDCILNKTAITFEIISNDPDLKLQTKLNGTTIKQEGYLKYENDLLEKDLPKFDEGEELNCNFNLETKQTTPPNKVTEAELNKFFEKPFKDHKKDDEDVVDDTEDYKAILKGIEIGTPATRSGTLEKVKKIGYIKADKNVLSITPLGERFIEILDKLKINLYKEKTVELSQELKKIYNDELSIKDVLNKAEKEISDIINQNVQIDKISNSNNKEVIGKCPICGKDIIENSKAFGCVGYKDKSCNFTIWKTIAGKKISKSNVKELLTKGVTKKIDGFTSKAGKKFSAKLYIVDDGSIKFDFNN